MRVLVACEFSGIVRDAFIAKGHDAISCDLLPSERPGPHIQGDVCEILENGWDLMIAHPPCTYLCSSGLHWNKRVPGRDRLTHEAMLLVLNLMGDGFIAHGIQKVALENPIGCISSKYRKPDQIIQPWQFGHDASKATCLWLKGLPALNPTRILLKPAWIKCECCDDFVCTLHAGLHVYDCPCPDIDAWAKRKIVPYEKGGRYANQTPSGQNKLGPSPDRAKIR